MSFLKDAVKSAVAFLLPAAYGPASGSTQPSHARLRSKASKRSAADAFENRHDTIRDVSSSKKRRLSQTVERNARDRTHKATREEQIVTAGIPSEAEEIQTAISTPRKPRKTTDQVLMPPPSALRATENPKKRQNSGRKSLDQNDIASQATRSTRFARSEINDEYDMEEARRRAAATQLPPNSGIWETGEQELFFHLSYRGFEPLLPYSWMIDFPTLPISIFAQQDDDFPLIQSHRSTAFRATKALEELLLIGTKIRDHHLSTQDIQSEPILEKATKRYITWALQDLGLPVKSSSKRTVTPVHAIGTMRADQTTHDVLRCLAISMHTLADRYRHEMGIRSSIELPHGLTPPRSLREETSIYHDSGAQNLPVIYGIAICRSVVTLFTLNCHMSTPRFINKQLKRVAVDHRNTDVSIMARADGDGELNNMDSPIDDEDLGLRYIAAFDFSDAARDVWNSFVIAIVAMQIRKTLQEAIRTKANLSSQESQHGEDLIDESWMSNVTGTDGLLVEEEKGNDDDPDA